MSRYSIVACQSFAPTEVVGMLLQYHELAVFTKFIMMLAKYCKSRYRPRPKGLLFNIFMEHVEQLAISIFSTPPILWCRYVDDTFCILDKSQTESFHQHLNPVCKHIQFTKEVKFKSSLPFLDVLVFRSGNNISTQIHKKPTHTDLYLPYTSHHPKHQKLAITHSYTTGYLPTSQTGRSVR